MNAKQMMKIFEETAYIRTGGSPEELRCAQYLQTKVAEMGLKAELQPFEVPMAEIREAFFAVDGVSIPCKGYLCAGTSEVEAPLYYLRNKDDYSLNQCRGKIVLIDGYLGYWVYQDLLTYGAVGCVSYNGDVNFADRDIDQRELRSFVHKGNRMPCVNIHARDAVGLIGKGVSRARIRLKQEEFAGTSHNVFLELPGQIPALITFTAHYDSTSLSQGAYDNMSGSIGLLALAAHYARKPHRYGLRFLWCGSEERGLLGSKAYCAEEENLTDCVLNINLDMIGCTMGKFISCVTAEEKLCHYISYLGSEMGFGVEVKQDVYSSDSTPFADRGIPAVSFARIAPGNTASFHNRYDTMAVMNGKQMEEDIAFITTFADRMANALRCPVKREMPEKMKEKLDNYLGRKRSSQ